MSILGAIGLLAALEAGGLPPALTIESDSACPSAEAVRKAMSALAAEAPPRSAAVFVRCRGDRMIVEFGWPGQARSEARQLAVESDCEARAQAAAVVIASWLGSLPGAALSSTPLGAPAVEIQYSSIVPRKPQSPPAAEPPRPRPRMPPAVAPTPELAPEPAVAIAPPAVREMPRSWLGFGLGASVGGGVVPGLRAELARTRTSTGLDLGWVASALVGIPRNLPLAQGKSSWIRPSIGVAGLATWGGPRLRWAIDLGPLVGLVVAWGNGYSSNDTDAAATWGLSGGLRLQLASSRVWGELRVVDWLQEQRVEHEALPAGIVSSVALPSIEGLLTLGWSFAL